MASGNALWRKYIGMHIENGETAILVQEFQGPDLQREYRLPLYLEVYNHSPTGFAWGYLGSGPAQTALAILMDHMLFQTAGSWPISEQRALAIHQEFKQRKVAAWDWKANFVILTREIEHLVAEIERAYSHKPEVKTKAV